MYRPSQASPCRAWLYMRRCNMLGPVVQVEESRGRISRSLDTKKIGTWYSWRSPFLSKRPDHDWMVTQQACLYRCLHHRYFKNFWNFCLYTSLWILYVCLHFSQMAFVKGRSARKRWSKLYKFSLKYVSKVLAHFVKSWKISSSSSSMGGISPIMDSYRYVGNFQPVFVAKPEKF